MGTYNTIFFLVALYIASLQMHEVLGGEHGMEDPTHGFSPLPLSDSNFLVEMADGIAVGNRYRFSNGVHKLWLLSTDKASNEAIPTSSRPVPCTDVRITGYDYSTGIWQFEGQVYVPIGTTGVSIMQISEISSMASNKMSPPPLMLLGVFDGALMHSRDQVLADDIYSKWNKMNVVHDVRAGEARIFINGDLKMTRKGLEPGNFCFKFGLCELHNSSYFMESLWKDIKVMKFDG